jgi:hypothetical protein
MSIIEQTLKTLASIDDAVSIELELDASIYGTDATRCAVNTPDSHSTVTIIPKRQNVIHISAKDPHARRLSLGLTLTKVLQTTIAPNSDK